MCVISCTSETIPFPRTFTPLLSLCLMDSGSTTDSADSNVLPMILFSLSNELPLQKNTGPIHWTLPALDFTASLSNTLYGAVEVKSVKVCALVGIKSSPWRARPAAQDPGIRIARQNIRWTNSFGRCNLRIRTNFFGNKQKHDNTPYLKFSTLFPRRV